MKCIEAKKFLSAFADGELATESNLLVLDHLKMCPDCAGRVHDIQSLRAGVKKAILMATAPQGFRGRLLAILRGGVRPVSAGNAVHSRPTLLHRMGYSLSLAATVVLAVGFWQWTLRSDSNLRLMAAPIQQVKLASDTLQQHRDCSRMADKHHRRSLSWDRAEIREVLNKELGFSVLVPDLIDWGYEFHSADTCGILGRKAAHIIYRSTEDGRLLSLFSCERIVGLNPEAASADCLTATFPQEAVAVWSSMGSSHLLLGAESTATLCEMSLTFR